MCRWRNCPYRGNWWEFRDWTCGSEGGGWRPHALPPHPSLCSPILSWRPYRNPEPPPQFLGPGAPSSFSGCKGGPTLSPNRGKWFPNTSGGSHPCTV